MNKLIPLGSALIIMLIGLFPTTATANRHLNVRSSIIYYYKTYTTDSYREAHAHGKRMEELAFRAYYNFDELKCTFHSMNKEQQDDFLRNVVHERRDNFQYFLQIAYLDVDYMSLYRVNELKIDRREEIRDRKKGLRICTRS